MTNYFIPILKENNVVLAPMAGITFESYRQFFSEYKVGLYYTEMVSDKGLIYNNKETLSYLPTNASPRPCGIQLFGSTKETLIEAISILERTNDNYDFIDLNLGCSVPKVTRGGCGSVLLKDLVNLEDLVKAVVAASSKPVSVKIRLGYNQNNVTELVQLLSRAGVQLIAIHPRYATELFKNKPHWDLVKNIQDLTSVPIVVSGDIYTYEDAINAIAITKAQGVMIARGGLGNPLLSTNIYEGFNYLPITSKTLESQKLAALRLLDLVCLEKGEFVGVKVLRGILPKFFQDFPNAKKYRISLTTALTKNEVVSIIKNIL